MIGLEIITVGCCGSILRLLETGVLGLMGNGPFLETLLVCRWVGWNGWGAFSVVPFSGFEVSC